MDNKAQQNVLAIKYRFIPLLSCVLIPVKEPMAVTKKPNSLIMSMVSNGSLGGSPAISGAVLASRAVNKSPKAVAIKEK